jgi:hypothetical protein
MTYYNIYIVNLVKNISNNNFNNLYYILENNIKQWYLISMINNLSYYIVFEDTVDNNENIYTFLSTFICIRYITFNNSIYWNKKNKPTKITIYNNIYELS